VTGRARGQSRESHRQLPEDGLSRPAHRARATPASRAVRRVRSGCRLNLAARETPARSYSDVRRSNLLQPSPARSPRPAGDLATWSCHAATWGLRTRRGPIVSSTAFWGRPGGASRSCPFQILGKRARSIRVGPNERSMMICDRDINETIRLDSKPTRQGEDPMAPSFRNPRRRPPATKSPPSARPPRHSSRSRTILHSGSHAVHRRQGDDRARGAYDQDEPASSWRACSRGIASRRWAAATPRRRTASSRSAAGPGPPGPSASRSDHGLDVVGTPITKPDD
jgi:hypothetical protein